jgi:hypothetical protein
VFGRLDAMSAALYIVLADADPGFDTQVDGKALSHAETELQALAQRLAVAPLMEFFSMDPADMLAEAEEFDAGVTADEVPAEQWFSAESGLKTVQTLLEYLRANPGEIAAGPAVANDLARFQEILEQARERSIRWHLAVDY